MLFLVCCLLCVVWWLLWFNAWLCVVGCTLVVDRCCPLFVGVGCSLCVARRVLFVVRWRWLLFVVCCVLCVVCCFLYVICCSFVVCCLQWVFVVRC